MSKKKNSPIQNLLSQAAASGSLSPQGLQSLSGADLQGKLQAGLGTPALGVRASEVLLVSIMPDDSSSIETAGQTQAIRDGHALVIETLRQSQAAESILIQTRLLNGTLIQPFAPIEQATLLDGKNYKPNRGTPLYDQSVVLLGSVLAKIQEFESAGILARSITLILTDGADVHSRQAKARDVACLARDLTKREGHIFAGMGVSDGQTDFRQVFTDMGIGSSWILTPKASPGALLDAFQIFSRMALSASRCISQSNLQGFLGT